MLMSVETIVEWWAKPVDAYGDSIEIFPCDSRREAHKTREDHADYPGAVDWELERVTRKYRDDGELLHEKVEQKEW
jgi:hypothetical protein